MERFLPTIPALSKIIAQGPEVIRASLATIPRRVPRLGTPALTIADFGYRYDDGGKLVHAQTGGPFLWLGQKHYDGLGDAITETLYQEMEQRFGLQRVVLPLDHAATGVTGAPIFVSPDVKTCDTLVVLCQGSGAVRPGMWARSLCINASLNEGSIFPYLRMIRERRWGVVVMNPNENTCTAAVKSSTSGAAAGGEPQLLTEDDALRYWLGTSDADWKKHVAQSKGAAVPVPGSERPEKHSVYVYANFVAPSAARSVLVIAHSYGGICTTTMVETFADDFERRCRAVALTDAINHEFLPPRDPGRKNRSREETQRLHDLMRRLSVNWVASNRPLNTVVEPPRDGMTHCAERSAGHQVHENTSEACRIPLFEFLDERVQST